MLLSSSSVVLPPAAAVVLLRASTTIILVGVGPSSARSSPSSSFSRCCRAARPAGRAAADQLMLPPPPAAATAARIPYSRCWLLLIEGGVDLTSRRPGRRRPTGLARRFFGLRLSLPAAQHATALHRRKVEMGRGQSEAQGCANKEHVWKEKRIDGTCMDLQSPALPHASTAPRPRPERRLQRL